jgi:biopolymer transport protein ExbD
MSDKERTEGKPKKKKADNPLAKDKAELSMTPMIDVTFLLLIFFMCACKFKTFEGKLASYLPKDRGMENYPIDKQKIPLKLLLRWNAPRKQCRVTIGQNFCGYGVEGIGNALRKARQIKTSGVEKAEIEAGGDVHMGWVVQALNMLVKADFEDIAFTGAASPLAE